SALQISGFKTPVLVYLTVYCKQMFMADIRQLLQTAQAAAVEAGMAILDVYRSGTYATTMKEAEFPVTEADKASHKILTKALLATGLPVLSEEGKNVAYQTRKQWSTFWLIDPLDGTEEFIHRREEFTVNIALMHAQTAVAGVIYVPCSDTLYAGSEETGVNKKENEILTSITILPQRTSFDAIKYKEGITLAVSRSHLSKETTAFAQQFLHPRFVSKGSALKFMMLLDGEADIYPRLGPTMEWDTAAAHAILRATGRGVYHLDFQSELVYNKPDLHNPFFVAL
ncbi:MAG TPA: 3'(2'),5'-bisphosphate nucleotidase CysQ, partial [Flavisolibacter sp.]|nr:3'(2'),5'-bisphosphate nucleotidase CysQ [Flavisolibacter sp.]